MKEAAADGFSTATDIADYLVRKGVPLPTGARRDRENRRGLPQERQAFSDLSLAEFSKYHPRFGKDIFRAITVENLRAPGRARVERRRKRSLKGSGKLKREEKVGKTFCGLLFSVPSYSWAGVAARRGIHSPDKPASQSFTKVQTLAGL